VEEVPLERTAIFSFVAQHARAMAPDARVLDAGAGENHYRELFATRHYSVLRDGPPDSPVDAVLCLDGLERLGDPAASLAELRAVLAPGGVLLATARFAGQDGGSDAEELRYTRRGLQRLLGEAGFDPEVTPCSDCFTTIAELTRRAVRTGGAPDGLDPVRGEARKVLEALSEALVALAPLDVEMQLPLAWSVRAHVRRPRS
jgi:SAM-dependent methyltransferase